MLLPIGDDNRDRRTTPFVNYLLIAINIVVFVFWQDMGHNEAVVLSHATIPAEILTGQDIATDGPVVVETLAGREVLPPIGVTPVPVFLTLIISMFMHGGWAHLGGNMLYLYIFGDNLEDAMGHVKYLFFYLLTGVIAGLAHVLSTYFLGQNLLIPSLGASGAISAVMGGYLRLFPSRSVHMWVFIFIISVPAFISVGMWFVFQVIDGLGMLGGEQVGNIAYAAHIGGFIAGLLIVRLFAGKRRKAVRNREYWR